MTPTPPNGHRPPAFTLIELMVVIVLIGILSAMIIPEMRGTYADALLRSTSRKLVDACNLASSRAISLNATHRVRLIRNPGRYVIERRVRDPQGQSGYLPARDLPGGEGELDPRITIAFQPADEPTPTTTEPSESTPSEPDEPTGDSADTIGFYSDGTADAAEILLRDTEGFILALHINPITARVRVIALGRP